MTGIEQCRAIVKNAAVLVSSADALKSVDYPKALLELMDLDEAELVQLAKDLEILDLSNDALEAKIEQFAMSNAPYAALVLKIMKIFMPKKV